MSVYHNMIIMVLDKHTHSCLVFDAQQLRVVFIRCGGSEKKSRSLPSDAYGLETLYSKLSLGL